MTEASIQSALFWSLKPHLAVPNIMMYGSYESDLLVISKAMLSHEYEIKLSKSDFKADFKKAQSIFDGFDPQTKRSSYRVRTKYEYLTSGKGPNRFSYVYPKGLIPRESVPPWAGIIEVEEHRHGISVSIVRQAKLLHKKEFTEARLLQAARSLMYKVLK